MMNKQEAVLADIILKHFAAKSNESISAKSVMRHFGVSKEQAQSFIRLFISDGYIEHLRHLGAPDHDFGIYFITHTGTRFILFDGGYCKKRKYDHYQHQNVQFTWIRHWAWFFAFVLSFIVNLYLLFFKTLI